jgi:hypothetical protein
VPRQLQPLRPLAACFAVLVAGCSAVRPLPPLTPELPLAAWERELQPAPNALEPVKAEPAEGGGGGEDEAALAKSAALAPKPSPASVTPTSNAGPPGGSVCLETLRERGVPFSESEEVLGVATPIVVTGPIGGVTFYSHEKKPFVMDCRLALALTEVMDELRALGVKKARYSGAYVYRTSHPGRMSMHAYGLAIDLHSFTFESGTLEVKKSFVRGQGSGCSKGMAELNLVACRIRKQGIFKEQLGPDDNAAHRDHFHLALKPLPHELAADLPWPAPPKRSTRSKRRAAR